MAQKYIYKFTIITENDTEIRELHALGIQHEVRGRKRKPVQSDYEKLLTPTEAKHIKAHPAVQVFKKLPLDPPRKKHKVMHYDVKDQTRGAAALFASFALPGYELIALHRNPRKIKVTYREL